MHREPWTMPDWMKPYARLVTNQGEQYITEAMNQLRTDVRFSKLQPLTYTRACEIAAQVRLLSQLRDAGIIADAEHAMYTLTEAAQYKGCSYHTVSRAVRRGKLKPDARVGRQYFVSRQTLDAWRVMSERAPKRYKPYRRNESVTPTFHGNINN